MPAVSPTVWLPGVDASPAPVVPPSPASAFFGGAVDLQVELARVGGRAEVLDHLDRAGVAGVGDRADDRRRWCRPARLARLVPEPEATVVAPLLALDRLV